MVKDFVPSSDELAQEITNVMRGNVVDRVNLYDIRADHYLEIVFRDGAVFKIRYDWIYEWDWC